MKELVLGKIYHLSGQRVMLISQDSDGSYTVGVLVIERRLHGIKKEVNKRLLEKEVKPKFHDLEMRIAYIYSDDCYYEVNIGEDNSNGVAEQIEAIGRKLTNL